MFDLNTVLSSNNLGDNNDCGGGSGYDGGSNGFFGGGYGDGGFVDNCDYGDGLGDGLGGLMGGYVNV